MTSSQENARLPLVLGVDGGNTKTIAVVATAEGEVVGTGRAGCADIYNAETEQAAIEAIRCAAEEALARAGAAGSNLLSSAFSLAGADWPEDFTYLRREIGGLGLGRQTRIVNDAIGALRAGTPDGVGVALACGTGIAVGARNGQGDIWYSGHWPIGAGGTELGLMALQAVYEARLGLGPPTSLTGGILAFFEAKSVENILKIATERGTPWTERQEQARLAPVLLDHAARGDAVAQSILRCEATRLARGVKVAAHAVGLDNLSLPVVLTGGVLRHPSGFLDEAIGAHLVTLMPKAHIIPDPPEPVAGAVLLAMDFAGLENGAAAVDRLVETLPGSELFDT